MTQELVNQIEAFYELSEHEQQETLNAVLTFANKEPEKFTQMVHSEKFDALNHLPIYYEALTEEQDNWADFFLNEIQRIFKAAKETKTPNAVLMYLDYFSYLEAENFKHRDKIVEILQKELDNQHPTFRFYALSLLANFIKANDEQSLRKIKQLLSDRNWRIRFWTVLILKDLGKLEAHEKLSFSDKIKSRLFNTVNFE